MDVKNKSQISVYYDGLCKVCAFEIAHYKKQIGADSISFIDITQSSFNATSEGLDPFLIHKAMHIKKNNGELVVGAEAFREIWALLPNYRWAYTASNNWLARIMMKVGYSCFIKIRPYLPRNKSDCSQSPYCETR